MLPTLAGLNLRPPGLQSDRASKWATKAGFYIVVNGKIDILCDIKKSILHDSVISKVPVCENFNYHKLFDIITSQNHLSDITNLIL